MDGLSAASSGIAVVSLAIQLIDSVREIRRFFRTLKDAPEELGRLLDLLEHMELMLEHIGKLVDPDSDISPSVPKAIQICEKALKKLCALIQKVERNSSTHSPLKRSLGFFRLACKKQEVEEIEKQLDRAVSNLNMVMTALNLHEVQRLRRGVSVTNTATATITEVVLRMESAAKPKGSKEKLAVGNRSRTSLSPVCRRSATHKVVYRGFLGSIIARIQHQSEDSVEGEYSEEFYARDEWSWVFIPSFLSRCVQVQCASSLGSVERTLRTCPILPENHPAWRMCENGDVTSIQELFSTRAISPYAIDRNGGTLLHFATWCLSAEMCDLLLDMGVGADVVDAYGNPARGLAIIAETCHEVENTYRVFTSANDDIDLAEFCEDYFVTLQNLSVEDFRSGVEKWVTAENVNCFNPSPLEVVTRRLCSLGMDPIEFHKWKDIASYLIAKKADFHRMKSKSRLWNRPACLLEVAVTSVAHPFEAHTAGMRFLEMLDASNVDLAKYLACERQYHHEGLLVPEQQFFRKWSPPWLTLIDKRAINLYIHEEQPFSLSWDWWTNPKETTFIVLHEFRHFGRAEHLIYDDEHLPPSGLISWPFTYPNWADQFGKQVVNEALLERFQRRSHHRWQKKMIKQAKIQGTYKRPKMPGTWIH